MKVLALIVLSTIAQASFAQQLEKVIGSTPAGLGNLRVAVHAYPGTETPPEVLIAALDEYAVNIVLFRLSLEETRLLARRLQDYFAQSKEVEAGLSINLDPWRKDGASMHPRLRSSTVNLGFFEGPDQVGLTIGVRTLRFIVSDLEESVRQAPYLASGQPVPKRPGAIEYALVSRVEIDRKTLELHRSADGQHYKLVADAFGGEREVHFQNEGADALLKMIERATAKPRDLPRDGETPEPLSLNEYGSSVSALFTKRTRIITISGMYNRHRSSGSASFTLDRKEADLFASTIGSALR